MVLIDAPPEKVIISLWFIAPEAKLSALAQNLCAPLTIIESSVGLANRYIALLSPDVNINVSDVESASQVSKVLKAPAPASDFPEAVTLANVLLAELAKYAPEPYIVSLQVTSEHNCVASLDQTIIINPVPDAYFDIYFKS